MSKLALSPHVFRVSLVLLFSALSFGVSHAQVEKGRILLGRTPVPAGAELGQFNPRSNVEQPFFLFVQKSENFQNAELFVRLRQLEMSVTKDQQGKEITRPGRVLQELGETTVEAKDSMPVLVRFGTPKADAKAAEGGKPAPLAFKALLGPPRWYLQVEVFDGKPGAGASAPLSRIFPVAVLVPSEYLRFTNLSYATGEKVETNTFAIDIEASPQFTGPPCLVELVLLPDLIPGLRKDKIVGNLRQSLSTEQRAIQLRAVGLAFDKETPANGVVALTVDGYPRALLFSVDFNRASTEQNPTTVTARAPVARLLDHRKAMVPSPKALISLEVDHANNESQLQLGIDRNRSNTYEPKLGELTILHGDRDRRVSIATAGPEGAIVLKTEVRDWQVPIDTAGFIGRLPYRLRVLDPEGKELLNAEQKPLPISTTGVEGYLAFDETPPVGVDFVADKEFPQELERGRRLRVEATGKDEESEIDRVEFFVGKFVKNKDGKEEIPPNADTVQGEPVAGKKDAWYAMLPGLERAGTANLSVQFVNKAGQSTNRTIEIRLIDPPAPGAGNIGGAAAAPSKLKVSGTVAEGDVPQPDLEVVLKDDKGAVKGITKTSKDPKTVGTFVFENVAPGAYTVSAAKVDSNTKGEKGVTVGSQDVKNVDLKLYR